MRHDALLEKLKSEWERIGEGEAGGPSKDSGLGRPHW